MTGGWHHRRFHSSHFHRNGFVLSMREDMKVPTRISPISIINAVGCNICKFSIIGSWVLWVAKVVILKLMDKATTHIIEVRAPWRFKSLWVFRAPFRTSFAGALGSQPRRYMDEIWYMLLNQFNLNHWIFWRVQSYSFTKALPSQNSPP